MYTNGTSEQYVGQFSHIDLGFPQEFLTRTKPIFLGEKYQLIDDHRHPWPVPPEEAAPSRAGAVREAVPVGAVRNARKSA
jgi:uncharacterized Fe-S cluster protein YjdI